jgi:hypothetical protein
MNEYAKIKFYYIWFKNNYNNPNRRKYLNTKSISLTKSPFAEMASAKCPSAKWPFGKV